MQNAQKLGEIIKKLRKDLKKDQKQFANLLGVTNVYISNLEKGKKLPSKNLLHKLYDLMAKEVPAEVLELLGEAKNENKELNQGFISNAIVYQLQEEGLYHPQKLKDLLKKNPDNIKYIFGLLYLLKEDGKRDAAREHLLQSLIQLRQPALKKWLEASYFLLESDYQTAISLMQKALDDFDKINNSPDEELIKQKAGLIFELANIYYEYAYYNYNFENKTTTAIGNFLNALKYHEYSREVKAEPYFEIFYTNIFWWLAFLGHESLENWRKYLEKAENVLLLDHKQKMLNSLTSQKVRGIFPETHLIQLSGNLAEAYAQLARLLLKDKNTADKRLLLNLIQKGELLLLQSSPLTIPPERKEYYNYYFSYACFFSISAEIKHKLEQPCTTELDLCSLGLQKVIFGNYKNKSNLFQKDLKAALEKDLAFFVSQRPDDFNFIKQKEDNYA